MNCGVVVWNRRCGRDTNTRGVSGRGREARLACAAGDLARALVATVVGMDDVRGGVGNGGADDGAEKESDERL